MADIDEVMQKLCDAGARALERYLWKCGALVCAVVSVSDAHAAQAGINVWTSRGRLPGAEVRALAVNPVGPTTVYAATAAGVFKSRDAGLAWDTTPGRRGGTASPRQ